MPMQMNARRGAGATALLLASVAAFAGDLGLIVAIAALLIAAVGAFLGGRVLVIAALLVVAAKTFYLEPTLWTQIATSGLATVPQTIEVYRILFLFTLLVPLILMGRHYVQSWWTEIVLACLAVIGLGAFLSIIAWRVRELPLLIVFGAVLAMAVFDFWRGFRQQWRQNGR